MKNYTLIFLFALIFDFPTGSRQAQAGDQLEIRPAQACTTRPAPEKSACQDSIDYYRNKADSLHHVAFLAKFKIERVKYYIKITKKNPKNRQFFFGWIIRAVEN